MNNSYEASTFSFLFACNCDELTQNDEFTNATYRHQSQFSGRSTVAYNISVMRHGCVYHGKVAGAPCQSSQSPVSHLSALSLQPMAFANAVRCPISVAWRLLTWVNGTDPLTWKISRLDG